MDKYKQLVNKLAEDCISELYGAHNPKTLTAVCQRQHKRGQEISKSIDPFTQSKEDVQKKLQDSVKEFKTREYAEKKAIPLNCSIQEKAQRIKECVGLIMDICPIMPVGQENPAKKEADKKNKKDNAKK